MSLDDIIHLKSLSRFPKGKWAWEESKPWVVSEGRVGGSTGPVQCWRLLDRAGNNTGEGEQKRQQQICESHKAAL